MQSFKLSNLPKMISDHRNYWAQLQHYYDNEYRFYRNPHYRDTDKLETLDVEKMKAVIDQLYYTVEVNVEKILDVRY